MARTPKNPIFKGIAAIGAAGGIDGFTREVHAETKRLLQLEVAISGMPSEDDDLRMLCYEVTSEVVTERLVPDLNRLMGERVDQLERRGLQGEELLEATHQATLEIGALPSQVTREVLSKIFDLKKRS